VSAKEFNPPITNLSLHPNGIWCLVSSANQTVAHLWGIDLKNKSFSILKQLLTDPKILPNKALFSPDGSVIALMSKQSATLLTTQSVLDTPENSPCPIVIRHAKATNDTSSFTTTVFSQENGYALLSDTCAMECFNSARQAIEVRFPDGDNGIVDCMTYSPDHRHNNLVATASPSQGQQYVKLWNLRTGNAIKYFQPTGDNPLILAILLSNQHLFTQEADKVTIWALQDPEKEGTVTSRAGPNQAILLIALHSNQITTKTIIGNPEKCWVATCTPDLLTVGTVCEGALSIEHTAPTPQSIAAAVAMVKKAQQQ
jgi:WD40 repeat protein